MLARLGWSRGRSKVAEDVEGAGGGVVGGDFDSGDEAEVLFLGFGCGFFEAVAGVVVGESDGD